jgi:hypothetical protein
MGWVIVLIIVVAVWDLYNLAFVIKNFNKELMFQNLKKFRNIMLLMLAIALIVISVVYLIEDTLAGVLCLEITLWIWIQALFSD